ncbi:MAG TPA: hypothetical protein ENI63_01285 [Candidatus Kaiserbacteria bacterium]|nr:hypothetical protein [Candidatus Kaiserbacteria bacterium]
MLQANDFFLFPFLSFGTDTLWYIFAGVVLIFLFYSISLVYHWFRYGMNIPVSILATIIYSVVSGIVLIAMIISFSSLLS